MPDFDSAKFDEAAVEADAKLTEMLECQLTEDEKKGALAVMGWWKDWYMHAGHKRLGRILVANAKAQGL